MQTLLHVPVYNVCTGDVHTVRPHAEIAAKL
eukprot:COSAG02_NODE_25418_length_659_cov_1.275000_1_plen_30_part_10